MELVESGHSQTLFWRISDIDFSAIDPRAASQDDAFLLLVAAASFVESASRVYARNLVQHFSGDQEIAQWLIHQWEPQELQHGRALRGYLEKAWPGFDWENAYQRFYADYTSRCTMEELEPVRSLELVARCVVETGTMTLYRAIHDSVREPVLKTLTGHISRDESRHYAYFYHFFERYQRQKRSSRREVLRTLMRRAFEVRNEDTECGLRYALAERERHGSQPSRALLHETKSRIGALVRDHYAFECAARMFLKPLALPPTVELMLRPSLIFAGRRLMLH